MLLSTANNDIINEDSYFITRQLDYDEDYDEDDDEVLSLNILYTGSVVSSNVENYIFEYFDSHRDDFISFVAQSENDYRELLDIDDKNELMEYLKDKEVLEFYTKSFTKSGYRSIDLLNDLKNNKTVKINGKALTIKHALIKADIVTLSIGSNDLFYKLNIGNEFDLNEFDDIYTYVDESIKDIDKLLYELRKSCKEQIMVFGFYNPFTAFSSTLANTVEPVILYANNKMEDLVKKYDMTYVDIHDMFLANDNYLPKKLEIHPTTLGYKAMAKSVISLIDKKTLAK